MTTMDLLLHRLVIQQISNHDMHSLAVMIGDLLDDQSVEQKIHRGPGPRAIHALRFLADAVRDVADHEIIMDAHDFDQRLARADDSVFNLMDVAELRAVPGPGIVIPSTGSRVALSRRANSVVAHPFFQRLRRLPQLDLLDSILPGATHTRFVHALHTYDIFRRSLTFLLSDWRFRLEVSREELEQALIFALVSQLGHFHFLHMFEDFLTGGFARDSHFVKAELASDEVLLNRVMKGVGGGFPIMRDASGATIGDLVGEWGHDWETINSLMKNPVSPIQGVLAALMDSPIDSEKLSYLADDSRATGIPFGSIVSGEPIFAALVVPSFELWNSRPRKALLGVRERSLAYLEAGVLARYWNIQTAYWNRTNRALQAMIKFQIQSLIVNGAFSFDEYLSATMHLSSDGALRWLNAQFEATQRRGKIPDQTVNPIAPLLTSERAIYKRLVTISGVSPVLGRDRDHQIFDNIRGMSLASEQQVIDAVAAELVSVIPGLVIHAGDILLDFPRPAREASSGEVLLYTDDQNEFMGELFDVSQLLKNRNAAFEGNVKRLRVFVSPRVYGLLRDGGKLGAAYDACLDMLRTRWSS